MLRSLGWRPQKTCGRSAAFHRAQSVIAVLVLKWVKAASPWPGRDQVLAQQIDGIDDRAAWTSRESLPSRRPPRALDPLPFITRRTTGVLPGAKLGHIPANRPPEPDRCWDTPGRVQRPDVTLTD